MRVKFNNRAKWVRKKGEYDYFDWEVYVDEDPSVIADIANVTYFLHKTFPEPVRTATDAESHFAVQSRGWGEFDIAVQVTFRDGHTERGAYRLDLSKPWNDDAALGSNTT